MARQFGSFNRRPPVWLLQLAARPPACFTHEGWVMYLKGVQQEAQDQDGNALRMRLVRGEAPEYCLDCTAAHQRRMRSGNQCHPPEGATTPLSVQIINPNNNTKQEDTP